MKLIKLNGAKTAEEVLETAGLMWPVEQWELMTATGKFIDSHKAIARGDNGNILGVVGKNYEPIQNHVAFAFADALLAETKGGTFENAGVFRGGRRIILQAKLGQNFDAIGNDRVDSYITFLNSHDGSSSLRVFLTPIRLVCQNQLVQSMREASINVTLRHTSSINERLNLAYRTIAGANSRFELFKSKAQYLAQKMVDKVMVNKFLEDLMGPTQESTRIKNQKNTIVRLFETGKGNTGVSAWHLYNAVVEWVDHERGKPETRAESALIGQGAAIKQKALERALAI